MNTIDTVAKEMNTITKQMTDRIMDEICPATLAFIDILEQILIQTIFGSNFQGHAIQLCYLFDLRNMNVHSQVCKTTQRRG